MKQPLINLPAVIKTDDPKWPQHIYSCSNDYGSTLYQSGPRVFEVKDGRGNIICHLDIDIALTIASIVDTLTKEGKPQ